MNRSDRIAIFAGVTAVVVCVVLGVRAAQSSAGAQEAQVQSADEQNFLALLKGDLENAAAPSSDATVPWTLDLDEEGMRLTVKNGSGVSRKISYHFEHGSVTRDDPARALVANGKGGTVTSGPVTLLYGMDNFLTITVDPSLPDDRKHYRVVFHSALGDGRDDAFRIALDHVSSQTP